MYITMGMDATVVYPTTDLKLRNPYDFPVVIYYVVSQGTVRVEILGRDGQDATNDLSYMCLNALEKLWGQAEDVVSASRQFETIGEHVQRFLQYLALPPFRVRVRGTHPDSGGIRLFLNQERSPGLRHVLPRHVE